MNINPDELESLDETLTESVPQTVAYRQAIMKLRDLLRDCRVGNNTLTRSIELAEKSRKMEAKRARELTDRVRELEESLAARTKEVSRLKRQLAKIKRSVKDRDRKDEARKVMATMTQIIEVGDVYL